VRRLSFDESAQKLRLATKSYRTTWSEIDVSAKACHVLAPATSSGPRRPKVCGRRQAWIAGQLPRSRRRPRGRSIDGGNRPALRATPVDRRVETCARCHARRREIASSTATGIRSSIRTYQRCRCELYHADGQIFDEVLRVWLVPPESHVPDGVTCSDCHDPHSLRLRAEGNAVCGQCHSRRNRYRSALSSSTGRRHPMRQLPHADAHLHGDRCAPRSRDPYSATGPQRGHRNAQRLQQLPYDRDANGPRQRWPLV